MVETEHAGNVFVGRRKELSAGCRGVYVWARGSGTKERARLQEMPLTLRRAYTVRSRND